MDFIASIVRNYTMFTVHGAPNKAFIEFLVLFYSHDHTTTRHTTESQQTNIVIYLFAYL